MSTQTPEGFYRTGDNLFDIVVPGDILFEVGDVPVIVEETVQFSNGQSAARVRYIGIAFSRGTSGIESLGDLSTETHVEFDARLKADNYTSLGMWRMPRNIRDYSEQQIRDFPGVSQQRYAEFMETMARAARDGSMIR